MLKLNYLFPHKFKLLGWVLLIPSLVIGVIGLANNLEPEFFNWSVFALIDDFPFSDRKYFSVVQNNMFFEVIGILIILSGLLVAFSKESEEDELISKLRLESLVWATYFNFAVLLLSLLFVYGMPYLMVMAINMFTILLFFIFRFNWQVWRLNRTTRDEE